MNASQVIERKDCENHQIIADYGFDVNYELISLNKCREYVNCFIDSIENDNLNDNVIMTCVKYLRRVMNDWQNERCYNTIVAELSETKETELIEVLRDWIAKLNLCLEFVQNEEFDSVSEINNCILYLQDVLAKWEKKYSLLCRANIVNDLAPEILVRIFQYFKWPGLFRLKQINKKWCNIISGLNGVDRVDVFRYLMLDKSRNIHEQIRDILMDRSKSVTSLVMDGPPVSQSIYPTGAAMNSAVSNILNLVPEKLELVQLSESVRNRTISAADMKSMFDQVVLRATNLNMLKCAFLNQPEGIINLSQLNKLQRLWLIRVIPSSAWNTDCLVIVILQNIDGNLRDNQVTVSLPVVKQITVKSVNLNIGFDISMSSKLESILVGASKGISIIGFNLDTHADLRMLYVWDCSIDLTSLATSRNDLHKLARCVRNVRLEFNECCTVIQKLIKRSSNQLKRLVFAFPHDLTSDQISISSPLLPKLLMSQLKLSVVALRYFTCQKYDFITAVLAAGEDLEKLILDKVQCHLDELCMELINPLRDITSRRSKALTIQARFMDGLYLDNGLKDIIFSEFNILIEDM